MPLKILRVPRESRQDIERLSLYSIPKLGFTHEYR